MIERQRIDILTPIDAFGRVRVSNPEILFASKQLVDNQPLYFDDQQTSGSGTTSTYSAANSGSILAVTASTAGTRVRQSFQRFNYQPGKSHLILITFNMGAAGTGITKRVGYFDDNNGIFLEQVGTGPRFVVRKGASDIVIPQASWNVDKMDGTGPSGITLDLTKVQILHMDFEWLGVGTVRFGFVINGEFICCHKSHTANVGTAVYHSNPNTPIRYEISNSGTGAANSLLTLCSSVTSEGGREDVGTQRSIDRGIIPLTTNNDTNIYALLGIRLKSTHLMATIRLAHASCLNPTNSTYRLVVMINPTIAGTAPTWVNLNNSAVQYANTTNATHTVTALSGTTIYSKYSEATSGSNTGTDIDFSGFFTIGSAINGTPGQLWICVQKVMGGSEDFYGSMSWLEQL